MFLVGLGSGAQLCLQPVANLFHKKWQGTVLASLSGAFQVSGLVFLILAEISSDRTKSYGGFAIILFILAISAFVILPNNQFMKYRDDDNSNPSGSHPETISDNDIDEKEVNIPRSSFKEYGKKTMGEDNAISDKPISNDQLSDREYTNDDHSEDKKEMNAIDLIMTWEYLNLVVWFSVQLTPLQYYIGTIGLQLQRKGDADGHYAKLFSTYYAGSALLAPTLGKIADVCGLGVGQGTSNLLK